MRDRRLLYPSVLGALFLALHEIGAHYTYSLVPYDAACRRTDLGQPTACA